MCGWSTAMATLLSSKVKSVSMKFDGEADSDTICRSVLRTLRGKRV